VSVRLSDAERELVQRAADRAGLSLHAWCRVVLFAAAGHRTLAIQLDRARQVEGPPPAKHHRRASTLR